MESKQKTYRELNTYIDRLKDRLRRIDAISNLRTYGLENEQISIYLDQNKLAKYGIGPYKVLNQLALQGFTTMSGNLELGNINLPIHITDSYNNERDVAEQIVYSDPKGNIVRLKDIAQIRREYPKLSKYIKSNGNKCVLLSIEMRPGNDIVKMGKDVHQAMDGHLRHHRGHPAYATPCGRGIRPQHPDHHLLFAGHLLSFRYGTEHRHPGSPHRNPGYGGG